MSLKQIDKITKLISEFNKFQQYKNHMTYSHYFQRLHEQLNPLHKIDLINQQLFRSLQMFDIELNQRLQNAVNQLQNYYPSLFEDIIKQQNEIFEKLINSIPNPLLSVQGQWQKLFEEQWQKLFEVIKSQHFDSSLKFQINNDGTIAIDEEIYSENEFKENIDKISRELAYSTSWNEFIEKLKELLESSSKVIRFIAITIFWIISFLGNFANVADYFDVRYSDLKNLLSENFSCSEQININKRDFKLKLRKTIIKSSLEIPSYSRFVIANILYVRNGSSRKAEIIDELPKGKIVKLVVKKRRWCLVQYEDEDTGEIKKGWVFLRYLERFKK